MKIEEREKIMILLILFPMTLLGTVVALNVDALSRVALAEDSSLVTPPSPPHLNLSSQEFVDQPKNDTLKLSEFALSIWFNSNHSGPGNAYVVSRGAFGEGEDAGKNMNYGIYISAGSRLRGGFESSNGTDYLVSPQAVFADGLWHNVVLTHSGSTLSMYVDGKLEDRLDTGEAVPDNEGDYPLRIGASSANSDRGLFAGLVDNLLVANGTSSIPINITSEWFENTFSERNTLIDVQVTTEDYPQILGPPRSPFVFIPGIG